MIGNLTPYPAYKESGVPWLGDIPTHWEMRRLKSICRFAYGDSLPSETRQEGDIAVFGSNGRVGSNKTANTRAPCIIIGRKGSFGKVNIAEDPVFAIDTTFFVDERFTEANLRWLFYLLSWLRLDDVSKDSAVPGLHREDAYQRLAMYPTDKDEQAAIARFLDHMDRRIRRYIRAKRKLIALLEEQKQAIVHRAVTRGIDPDVRLKPSGVEWLGEIPEHWEIVPIKYLLYELNDRSTTGKETLLSLRINHGLVPHDEHFARPGQASSLVGYKLVRPGQVVLNKLQANNGLVFASEIFGVVSPDYAVFNSSANVNSHYLTALFRTSVMKHKFRVESKGLGTGTAGFLRLYTDRFGAIKVALPPRDEQLQIMHELDAQLKGSQNAIAHTQGHIDLIREYRTRLISDVVTGKLDVREAVAHLPEEAAEPEEVDDIEEMDEDENVVEEDQEEEA